MKKPMAETAKTDEGEIITLRAVTRENWRATLELAVRPEQQRFTADYAPIAAIGLAKAYIRPGGAVWTPYAIYAGATMVGFVMLAGEPDTSDQYWIFHFFIDQRYQRRGYGRAALEWLVEMVRREYPRCQTLRLVVHPENTAAQWLYNAAGFRPTGGERWGEPVYQLALPTYPPLRDGETWRADGGADAEDDSWFWTIAEWGHPWPIPCIVCGRDARIKGSVAMPGGAILFGACSPKHEQTHAAAVRERVGGGALP